MYVRGRKGEEKGVEELRKTGAHRGGCTSREVSLFNQILAGGWFEVCNITFSDFFLCEWILLGCDASLHGSKYENQMKINETSRLTQSLNSTLNSQIVAIYQLDAIMMSLFYWDSQYLSYSRIWTIGGGERVKTNSWRCGWIGSGARLLLSSAEGPTGQLILMKNEWGGGGSHQLDMKTTADSSRERNRFLTAMTAIRWLAWRGHG